MAPSYLIDTNILVHAIRQKKGRWEFLEGLVQAGGSLACSVLTVGELYAGMKPHEKTRTEELLAGFERYEVTGEIARYAGLLKNEWAAKGFTFTLVDMTIAATAIAHKLALVTENRKDFPMPELTLLDLPPAAWSSRSQPRFSSLFRSSFKLSRWADLLSSLPAVRSSRSWPLDKKSELNSCRSGRALT